jgi:hypothetical protein
LPFALSVFFHEGSKADEIENSARIVMPDLIRHPEVFGNMRFSLSRMCHNCQMRHSGRARRYPRFDKRTTLSSVEGESMASVHFWIPARASLRSAWPG